jgi:hypothetical protein
LTSTQRPEKERERAPNPNPTFEGFNLSAP